MLKEERDDKATCALEADAFALETTSQMGGAARGNPLSSGAPTTFIIPPFRAV